MAGAAFIGGNLQAIEDSARKLVTTGQDAVASGDHTKTAADELESAVSTSTDALLQRFQTIAGELEQAINAAHQQLEGTDWQGQSREAALEIKASLKTQVGKVLSTASDTISSEKTAFVSRAGQLVSHVETQFKGVMRSVDEEYGKLAQAARDTKANLEAADQTIKVG